MNFDALKEIAIEHGDRTLDYLNELVDVDAGLIRRRDIKIAIMGRGKLAQVLEATPLFATDPDFADIRVLDPLTQGVFNGLLQAGVIDQGDLDAINALGTKKVPRWQTLQFTTDPHQGDIDWALKH